MSDLLMRRDKCECVPTERGTKRCFWLPFDQVAFRAASLKPEAELRQMFRDLLVWSDPQLTAKMRSLGLVDRIHTASVRPHAHVPAPPALRPAMRRRVCI